MVPKYEPVIAEDDSSSNADTEDMLLLKKDLSSHHRRSFMRKAVISLACVLALAVYTSVVASIALGMTKETRRQGTRFLQSPANKYITYEPHVMAQSEAEMYGSKDISYFGQPNPDTDKLWHDLLKDQNLGFSKELMEKLGRVDEGIKMPDGTYLGSIMAFHNLHCLKHIYHHLHPKYYELDKLHGNELNEFWAHTNHCLHMLKQSVMCEGDTTVLTMKWDMKKPLPIPNMSSPHECVNWDRLMDWVKPNSVDIFAENMFVHPTFGPIFVGGRPSKDLKDSLGSSGKGYGVDTHDNQHHQHGHDHDHQYDEHDQHAGHDHQHDEHAGHDHQHDQHAGHDHQHDEHAGHDHQHDQHEHEHDQQQGQHAGHDRQHDHQHDQHTGHDQHVGHDHQLSQHAEHDHQHDQHAGHDHQHGQDDYDHDYHN